MALSLYFDPKHNFYRYVLYIPKLEVKLYLVLQLPDLIFSSDHTEKPK
jgi:hypothetical protein